MPTGTQAGSPTCLSVCPSVEGSAALGQMWSWVLVSSLTRNIVCAKVLTRKAVTPNRKVQLRIPSLANRVSEHLCSQGEKGTQRGKFSRFAQRRQHRQTQNAVSKESIQ